MQYSKNTPRHTYTHTKKTQAQEEVDRVMGASPQPTLEHYSQLRYCMRCVCESMRLYPHPPVLLRRALVDDTLPGTLSGLRHETPPMGFPLLENTHRLTNNTREKCIGH